MAASASGPTPAAHLSDSIYRKCDNDAQSTPIFKTRRLARSIVNPKTASEKAMFRRNSTESPLLRLPYEIRTRIWNLVLGERIMHIRLESRRGMHGVEAFGATGRAGTRGSSRRSLDADGVLRGSECACPVTERELFTRYMRIWRMLVDVEAEEKQSKVEVGATNSYNLYPNTMDPDVMENLGFDSFVDGDGQRVFYPIHAGAPEKVHTMLTCHTQLFALKDGTPAASEKSALKNLLQEHPHAVCKQAFRGRIYEPLPQPAVYLLRSCRQVYGEANAFFWSSNTFSFDWSRDFSRFIRHSGYTMSMITKLHIDVRTREMLSGWHRALRMKGVITSFWSLKFLHLHFDDADSWGAENGLMDELADTFVPLRGLGLKDVTVVIAWYGLRLFRCGPKNDYVKLVERLRSVLMGQVNMAEM